MNEQRPKVTVLMPVHNAEKYIGEAVQSVLGQSYQGFELLIINDGSTDDTKNIINSFNDHRIRVIDQDAQGISVALNVGLQAARADLIARFDADDICFKERLEKQTAFLDANPDHVLMGSDAEYILENGDHLFDFHSKNYKHEDILQMLYKQCPFIHAGVMYRKDEVMKAGGYSIHAHTFEDHLLWVNLLNLGKGCNLPEALIKVRINPNSVTIDERWRGEDFHRIKRKAINRGSISEAEGNELLSIIKGQETRRIKNGSYHALCSKKFLADNYQPAKARAHAAKAIHINPFRLDNYGLLVASYFPIGWIKWIRRRRPVPLS